jgi:cysteine desulfurase
MSLKNIYLDYSASTPVDPQVLEKMLPYFGEHFANPSSQHRSGWQAARGVDLARLQVSRLLNARVSKEIIFTSGASEANSLALLGHIQALRQENPTRSLHAITSQVEHKSVIESFRQLQEIGVAVDFLPANKYGQIEIDTLARSLKPETVLMSFMWANNEIGSINPMAELSAFAKKNGICFHSDATQICGKMPIDLQEVQIDMLALSSHKMYGPKGVGALYLRHEGHSAAYKLWPVIRGGGQEHQLRAGTLNVPGIVGFGSAAELALNSMPAVAQKLNGLTSDFMQQLQQICPHLQLNGHPTQRLPGHLHLSFPGVRWDQWLPRMSHLCVSTASACGSESSKGSHVLHALGFTALQIHASLRISLGKFTNLDEINAALPLFQRVFNQS